MAIGKKINKIKLVGIINILNIINLNNKYKQAISNNSIDIIENLKLTYIKKY